MSVAIGIDLGTTNTAIAVVAEGTVTTLEDEHGRRLLPSMVSFHPQGSVLVGELARDRRTVDPKNTIYSVKRLIGRPFSSPEVQRTRAHLPFELNAGPKDSTTILARGSTYAVPEISAFVLRRAKAIAEAALETPVDRAVITVPANFNELQRASTKVAGRLAGFDVLRIINEPTAAALAYGQLLNDSKRIVVYDFGGGTFDVTVLDLSGPVFEVLSTAGDTMLGGDDIDIRLAEILAEQCLRQTGFDGRGDGMALAQLRITAEYMKRELSEQLVFRRRVGDIGFGHGGKPIEFDAELNRDQIEALARPFVQRTLDVTKQAMETIGIGLGEIDEVLLVGGSTRMPLVADMVSLFFGKPASLRVNPDEVVALGAGIQAHALYKPKVVVELPKPKEQRSRTITQTPTYSGIAAANVGPLPVVTTAGSNNRAPKISGFGAVDELASAVVAVTPAAVAPAAVAPAAVAPDAVTPPAPRAEDTSVQAVPSPDSVASSASRIAAKPLVQLRKTAESPPRSVQSAPDAQAAPTDQGKDAPSAAAPDVRATAAPVLDPGSKTRGRVRRRDPREESSPPPRIEDTKQPVLFELTKSAPSWSDSGLPPALPTAVAQPGTTRGIALGKVTLGTLAAPRTPQIVAPADPLGQPRAPAPTMFGGFEGDVFEQLQRTQESPSDPFEQMQSTQESPNDPFAASTVIVPSIAVVAHATILADGAAVALTTATPLAQAAVEAARVTPRAPPTVAAPVAAAPLFPSSLPGQLERAPEEFQVDLAPPEPAWAAPKEYANELRAIPTKARAALLVDVTPFSLRVETVAGYSDALITRNTPVPSERTRVFMTAQDGQTRVTVRVAQGESVRFSENQFLGELELTGIHPAARGESKISVTFALDADGTLQVHAQDAKTKAETRATMRLLGAAGDEADFAEMLSRQQSRSVS